MENKIQKGIIGILSLLVVFGGAMYLTQDEFDNAYVCDLTEEVGIFYGGISNSGLTGYPHAENRTEYKRCKKDGINGDWIPLSIYLEEQGISFNDLLEKKIISNPPAPAEGIKWECSPKECVRIV